MRQLFAAAVMLAAAAMPAAARDAPSAAVLKDMAPTGKLRTGINFGNLVLAQKGPNGEPRGVSAELAAALAAGTTDVGFFAIEPVRAAEVEFSAPYVIIQGTYMVRQDSPLKDVDDVDKPGIKIGVGLASVYDLYLTRTLKHAELVRAKVGGAAAGIPIFIDQKLDAAAGVREPLDAYAKEHPEMRVMKGAFEQIGQAMGTVKGRTAGAAYVRAFVEDMKANGFVADALKRSEQKAPVAPKAM